MKNAKELVDWIKANTSNTSEADAVPAALWFVAYREAEDDHGSNTVKDWAHVILNGLPGVTPEYVSDWLESCDQDDLVDLLEAHFKPR